MDPRLFFLHVIPALSLLLVGCGKSDAESEKWEGELLGRHDESRGTLEWSLDDDGGGESTISGRANFESTVEWEDTEDGMISVVTTCKDVEDSPHCDEPLEWTCERDDDELDCYALGLEWTSVLTKQ